MSFVRHFTVAEAIIQPKGKKMARDVVLLFEEVIIVGRACLPFQIVFEKIVVQ
jgi:hypothetical protein